MELGDLEAAGPSAGSVADPHKRCSSPALMVKASQAVAHPAVAPRERGGRSPSGCVTPQ